MNRDISFYSDNEHDLLIVAKYNQQLSYSELSKCKDLAKCIDEADKNIDRYIDIAEKLLHNTRISNNSIKYNASRFIQTNNMQRQQIIREKQVNTAEIEWDELVAEANEHVSNDVTIYDLLSQEEIDLALQRVNEIEELFSSKTSISNKVDLSFLAVATGLLTLKSLLFPYVAKSFGYGAGFDQSERLAHNDPIIEQEHREANNSFRDTFQKYHENGEWVELLYRTPPYDITRGAASMGINMGGKYHRMATLGHDPILGWVFGTANILTDTITLSDFQTFRVTRNPMVIMPEGVPLGVLFYESWQKTRQDFLNLPAALFAQCMHYKSDVFTKVGLPIPVLGSFSPDFAGKLYREQYDALCFGRDVKITGASFVVSKIIDILISLSHRLFRAPDIPSDLFDVRTRKILLIANTIASTSNIIYSTITSNPKNLDLGGLVSTAIHLFSDIRYILRIKQEFIESELQKDFDENIDELNSLCNKIIRKN